MFLARGMARIGGENESQNEGKRAVHCAGDGRGDEWKGGTVSFNRKGLSERVERKSFSPI